ncbi:putative sulfate exporter family transporter [Chelatococcus sp. SYSU_G07232]|uniref:Sulfate exporter family transporter n=1 Tax=Chelatococcus albus TaxID=3047466 RepID=A0ABT7AIS4_9HYPH|nr:putative sulfate exporter family transporter [Chelatococcus sp. SYSU_G07232]MDJ1158995.1 putative sulfate exporter family transporter [Chelatococcus sp. SYSU_G07232]
MRQSAAEAAESASAGGAASPRSPAPHGRFPGSFTALLPGFALAAAVAGASAAAEPASAALLAAALGRPFAVPAVVIALVLGVVLSGLARRPAFPPGLVFSVKKLLRWAVALLGLKVAIADVLGLGWGTALVVVLSMAVTLVSGIWLARLFGRSDAYGALAGGATAVCGASAALATATVLPDYENKEADVAFTVVVVNALSTLAMVAYPALAALLGFDDRTTGILLGATIHDVAQVVGAGYAVSDVAGNAGVVVKLFRVLLLLPVVVAVGWWFSARGGGTARASVPVPVFALAFLALVIVNSFGLLPGPVKATLVEASRWGLLIAIAALGLGTSPRTILNLGWRHMVVALGTTLVILATVTAALLVA